MKNKTITIHYLPETGLAPETLETTGKAGYHVHSDPEGKPIGYRLYVDSQTVLVPAQIVHKIVVDL